MSAKILKFIEQFYTQTECVIWTVEELLDSFATNDGVF